MKRFLKVDKIGTFHWASKDEGEVKKGDINPNGTANVYTGKFLEKKIHLNIAKIVWWELGESVPAATSLGKNLNDIEVVDAQIVWFTLDGGKEMGVFVPQNELDYLVSLEGKEEA